MLAAVGRWPSGDGKMGKWDLQRCCGGGDEIGRSAGVERGDGDRMAR